MPLVYSTLCIPCSDFMFLGEIVSLLVQAGNYIALSEVERTSIASDPSRELDEAMTRKNRDG